MSSVAQNTDLQNGVTFESVTDGKELNIRNISNLTIEGSSEGKTEILVKPRYAQVMRFESVCNVTISNITAGHTPAEYICDEGVLSFQDSEDIKINNCELYGCGSIGLSLYGVQRLDMANSNINHCSLRAVQIYDSKDINLRKSKISNHEAYSNIILVDSSIDILFEECEMTDNNKFEWNFMDVTNKSNVVINKCRIANNSYTSGEKYREICFFKTLNYDENCDSSILVKDTEFNNNVCDYITDNKKAVVFESCTFNGNVWSE